VGAAVSTIHVHLRCPSCGHEWHEATIITNAWWGAVTPEQIAQQPWCKCGQAPPMQFVNQQPELFAGVVSENTERGTA
jgi:hypothetical protein